MAEAVETTPVTEAALPEGISVIPGFDETQVRQHVANFITALGQEIIQAEVPPILIFPLNGSMFAYYELMMHLKQNGYTDLQSLPVYFAIKGIHGNYEVPDFEMIDGRRVLIVDDIADSLAAYVQIREAISVIPELWAMSRKASTDISQFTGFKIQAVFPQFEGEDPWVNSGFGMNRTDEQSAETSALERLAAVCLLGTTVDLFKYWSYLITHSYYPNILEHPLYQLLATLDSKRSTPTQKLVYVTDFHKAMIGVPNDPQIW